MNDTTHLAQHPDVAAFVAAVRARLGDLTEEEREELVGGLEADLAERLAEGETDLGDPEAYATELRAAAGLEVRRRRSGVLRPAVRMTPAEITRELDRARRAWFALMARDGHVAAAWDIVLAMRPAWWVLRAWLAVELLDRLVGPSEYATVMPSLGLGVWGPLLLVVAVVVSVQLGRRVWWPASEADGSLAARLVLLGLNGLAVVVLMSTVLGGWFIRPWDAHALANGEIYQQDNTPDEHGLMSDGHYVRNVFAYDAAGKPLTGVQLYDQKGRPLDLVQDPYIAFYGAADGRVLTYPWLNGSQQLWNVFPLPVRSQGGTERPDAAWSSSRPPALPGSPLAVVPPAALPTPAAAKEATAQPTPTATPGPTPQTTPPADSEKPGAR
jgi:hypothetical protein